MTFALHYITLNDFNLVPETAPSNYNEKILPSAGDCSIQQTVKDKDGCASITVSYTKLNEQIADYRQQKREQLDLFKITARYGV